MNTTHRNRVAVIDLDRPRGVARTRLLKAALAISISTEAGKRKANAERAGQGREQ